MKPNQVVVVTGATGVIGRALLGRLLAVWDEVRVVSRSEDRVASGVPESIKIYGYSDLDHVMSGANVVIHLAARNNDQAGTAADFDRDNRQLSLDIAEAAKRNGVARLIFATSIKALAPAVDDFYGRSKAAAESGLADCADASFCVHFARIAAVHGPGVRGKLRFLQRLPLSIRRPALGLIRSLLPLASIDQVATDLSSMSVAEPPLDELCIADSVENARFYQVFLASVNLGFLVVVPTVLALPFAISALAVAASSRGGVFFVQRRVGVSQEEFDCRKFRSMKTGTPERGTHQVAESCVTKVGAFLRRFKLDELPQVTNVFRGEMSVVGPRPCLPGQLELIHERERYGVFSIKPGITGLAQVSGVDMSEPRRLAIYDHRYVAFRCIVSDLKIAWQTISGAGVGDPIDSAGAPSSLRPAATGSAVRPS